MQPAEYENYEEWKQWKGDDFGSFSKSDSLYYLAELKRAGLNSLRGLHVLEIGFGNGGFAGFVASQGGNYVGLEINSALVERGRSARFNVSLGGIDTLVGATNITSFDLVVAFDVLEHIEIAEIERTIRDVRNLLRPGAIFLARMPSGDSPFGRSTLYGDITHKTTLGTSAIKQVAMLHDFEFVHTLAPALPLFGLGLKRFLRRSILQLVRKMVALAINVAFHDAQPLIIDSNLIFALRKPIHRDNLARTKSVNIGRTGNGTPGTF